MVFENTLKSHFQILSGLSQKNPIGIYQFNILKELMNMINEASAFSFFDLHEHPDCCTGAQNQDPVEKL